MDFFQKHDKDLRKGRLLQAAVIMLAKYGLYPDEFETNKAITVAFRLEELIEKRLDTEK